MLCVQKNRCWKKQLTHTMHYQSLEHIIAYGHGSPLALSAASPEARLAVERSAAAYRCGSFCSQLQPFMQKDEGQHMLNGMVRCVWFVDYYRYPIDPFPTCEWWLQREGQTRIALHFPPLDRLHSCGLPSANPCSANILRYLRLAALSSLTVQSFRLDSVQCLPVECPLLEELSLLYTYVHCGLEPIGELQHLRYMRIEYSFLLDIRWVTKCSQLRTLSVTTSKKIDLNPICLLESLTSFEIMSDVNEGRFSEGEEDVVGWEAVEELPYLQSLAFSVKLCPPYPVARLKYLRTLRLHGANCVFSIEWLVECRRLEELTLHRCNVSDFSPIWHLSYLRVLRILSCSSTYLEWLPERARLETLELTGAADVVDFSPIAGFGGSLRTLGASITFLEEQEPWLSRCTLLEELRLSAHGDLFDCGFLVAMHALRILTINSQEIRCVEGISNCVTLEELRLKLAVCAIVDYTPLSHLRSLRVLDLSETKITSIRCLAKCSMLEELHIPVANLVDLGCIGLFKSLRTLKLGPVAGSEQLQATRWCLRKLPHLKCTVEERGRETFFVSAGFNPPQWPPASACLEEQKDKKQKKAPWKP